MSNTPTETEQSNGKLWILLAALVGSGLAMMVMVLLAGDGRPAPAVSATRPARIAEANAATGWQVPDFSLQTLNGETVSLSDYRGQIVFVNFWATWCVPCQREMPAFEEFMAAGREDAVILAVNNGENIEDVRNFAELYNLNTLPILLDEDFTVTDGFGVMNLPVTYVIDETGVVRNFKLGEVTLEDIETYIDDLQST